MPDLKVGPTGATDRASGLLEEDTRAADLLCAQRAQEARHDAIHQLEIGRQRGNALRLRIQDLFAEAFRVEDGAGSSVDEDEARLQDEALPLHVRPHGNDRAAA